MTEWKPIIGYENEYLVSNNGDVFSLRSKKRLKQSINEKGYMRVCLQKRGMKSWKRVNRLVAEAFIPNPEDKPTVNHKNGIRDDNHVWNLEWATVLEQNSDPMRIKNMSKSMMRSEYVLRKKRKVLQFDSDGSIYAIHEGLHDAARSVGTTVGNIFLCCNGQRKTCKGFKFQYASYSSVCDAGDCGSAERRSKNVECRGRKSIGGDEMKLTIIFKDEFEEHMKKQFGHFTNPQVYGVKSVHMEDGYLCSTIWDTKRWSMDDISEFYCEEG